MNIDLVFRNQSKAPEAEAYSEAFFRPLLERILTVVAAPQEEVEVSVTLLDPVAIRELNHRYRGKDMPTDVLSFPLSPAPSLKSALQKKKRKSEEDSGLGAPNIPGYTVSTLGDIFICPLYATEKAREEGVSMEAKMSWLAVHGMLHLLGYDHPDNSVGTPTLQRQGEKMTALEKKILKEIS